MRITFVSNYLNHHQIPVSNALYEKLGEQYNFIQTEEIEAERVQMGWADASKDGRYPYLKLFYQNPEACRKLIMDSDVVIFGGTDEEAYIQPRLQAGKLVIRYSERIYKTGQWKAVSPRGLRKKYIDHTKYRRKPVYLLCAGAYVPSDFHIVRAYPGKMLKWGYFPETKKYDIEELMSNKEAGSILWAGRFIDWKHPEMMIDMAERLKKLNLAFHVTMIGGGEMYDEILQKIEQKHLEEVVTLAGYKKPEEVRAMMERASIYISTSDYQEGWGAVLNEAMNSGCAVVASHALGATPYLISHNQNGIVFESGNRDDLVIGVKQLLESPELCRKIGTKAYSDITGLWNAEEAAERLLKLAEYLVKHPGDDLSQWNAMHTEGPCSEAKVIPERKMCSVLKRI